MSERRTEHRTECVSLRLLCLRTTLQKMIVFDIEFTCKERMWPEFSLSDGQGVE